MLNVHLFEIPDWLNHLVNFGVMLAAFWRGGWRPRAISTVLMLLAGAHHLFCAQLQCSGAQLLPSLLLSLSDDLVILVLCLLCVRRTESYWVVWAGSFALLSVLTDLMALNWDAYSLWAYGSANIIWFHLLNAATLWGVFAREPDRVPGRRAIA